MRPGAAKLAMLADLVIPMAGPWVAGMVTDDCAVIADPVGGVPVAVPVLVMLPRSRSAWVVV